MKNHAYNVNRPVHLARRDVFFEKALELFRKCHKDMPPAKRIQQIDATLYCLKSAVDHGTMASKATTTKPHEDPFLHFIRMVLYDLYSVRVIMENEAQLKDRGSALWKFLHRNGGSKETVEFARSGDQLLQDVAHLFGMAEQPFQDIQKALAEEMDENDRSRYRRAYDSLKAYLDAKARQPHATFGRTFSATLEMKYG